jgi:4-amino-4-deoxy-L-arabinose transferase-like glycosyltransferase
MFLGQQLNRYTSATYNNPQPWWFYLLAITVLLFPWVFFALSQVRRQGRQTLEAAPALAKEWWSLCWIWVVAILVFFSLPNSKLIGYTLPVMPALALLAALGWQRVMAHRAHAGKIFAVLCLLNIAIALTLVTKLGAITRNERAQDVAQAFACVAHPTDTVYVADAFPYDLPFYAQTSKPFVVMADWPVMRQQTGDSWFRELFEGADFDAQAALVLQAPEALTKASTAPGNWFATRIVNKTTMDLSGWALFYEGTGWRLYQSGGGLAAKSPEPAQHKGLPGCKNQGHK